MDAVTKAAEEADERLKSEVTEVWVLEEILPYDGSEVLGVFLDVLRAKGTLNPNIAWRPTPNGEGWFTYDEDNNHRPYFLLSRHQLTH